MNIEPKLENLKIAMDLLEFIDAILQNEKPVLTHFGVVNVETKERHDAVSLWGCLIERGTLNPMQRIEQLAEENGDINKKLESATRWIPVGEALPTQQGHYLVKVKHSFPKNCNVLVAEFYDDRETFYCECNETPLKDVTHWRNIEFEN